MPRASLFTNFFTLKKEFHGDWWWIFTPRSSYKLFTGTPSAIHGWKGRFFFVRSATSWGFNHNAREPVLTPNDDGRAILEGDRADFNSLVACGVGENASDINQILEEENLRLAGIGPLADFAEDPPKEMGRPNLERLRELANKRAATKGAGREARKKRREDGAPRPRAPPVGIAIREAGSEESDPPREPSVEPTPLLGAEDQPSAEEIAEAGRVAAVLVGALPSGAGEPVARKRAERGEELRGKAPVVETPKPPRPTRRNVPPPPLPPGPMIGDSERPLTSFPGRNKGESASVVGPVCQAEESDAVVGPVEASDAVPPASGGVGVVVPPVKKPPTMPTGLAHPEGWPEAHRPPGLSVEFSDEEWRQIKASADAALGGERLVKYWKRAYRETEETYRTVYAEAAYWKRAAALWEAECAPWADVAGKRGKEIDRLKEELSTVGQLAKALQQTSVEQERGLEALQRSHGTLKGQKEYLERKLGEARVEPDALRAELAAVRARLEASGKELSEARVEPDALRAELTAVRARLEASERELAESRSEGCKLKADSDAALAQKEEELKAAAFQAEGASKEHAAAQALLTDSRAEVERLTAGLREVLAEAKSASEAHDREAASFRLEMEGCLTRAVADYKASQSFQDEMDESGLLSYELGFQDGLQQVRASYPDLDLSIVKRAGEGADEDAAEDSSEDPSGEDEDPPAPGGV